MNIIKKLNFNLKIKKTKKIKKKSGKIKEI